MRVILFGATGMVGQGVLRECLLDADVESVPCFFCLGVSSAGMDAKTYYRLTFELTTSVAAVLARWNRGMTFIYVSGAGTDSSERGRVMWARVKGKTENALLHLPFKAAYMFRPGYIQPLHGIRTKTKLYAALYAVMAPLYPVWAALFPKYVTTTECIGRAMLKVAKQGSPRKILETWAINGECEEIVVNPR